MKYKVLESTIIENTIRKTNEIVEIKDKYLAETLMLKDKITLLNEPTEKENRSVGLTNSKIKLNNN